MDKSERLGPKSEQKKVNPSVTYAMPVGAKQIRGSEKPHQKEKESIGKEKIVCCQTLFLYIPF